MFSCKWNYNCKETGRILIIIGPSHGEFCEIQCSQTCQKTNRFIHCEEFNGTTHAKGSCYFEFKFNQREGEKIVNYVVYFTEVSNILRI